jgi:hypothetical protein
VALTAIWLYKCSDAEASGLNDTIARECWNCRAIIEEEEEEEELKRVQDDQWGRKNVDK